MAIRITAVSPLVPVAGIETVRSPEVADIVLPKLNTAIALLEAEELYIMQPSADVVTFENTSSAISTKARLPALLVVIVILSKLLPPAE